MIIGTKAHDGSDAIGHHLLNREDNESIEVRSSGLLASDDVFASLAELRRLARGSRAKKALLHAFASPSIQYRDDQLDTLWELYEEEFDLLGQPWVEVRHRKKGKGGRVAEHAHRVYLRVDPTGKTISLSQLGPRQEKVARTAEYLAGEKPTSGAFNGAVIEWLRRDGRSEIADALVRAGLGGRNASPATTAADRAMAERTGDLAVDEIDERVRRAWVTGQVGSALANLLQAGHLRVAQGDKATVIITPRGNAIPMLRALNRALRRTGQPAVRKAELDRRLVGAVLPAAAELDPLLNVAIGRAGHVGKPRQERRSGRPLNRLQGPRVLDTVTVGPRIREGVSFPIQSPSATPDEPTPLVPDAVRSSPEFQAIAARYMAEFFSEVQRERLDAPPGTLRVLEAAALSQSSDPALSHVSQEGWASYRARLAGLPAHLGAQLAWVERLSLDHCSIRLKAGPVLTARPDRIDTSHADNSCIDVIVACAVQRRWTTVSVASASMSWCEDLARALTRAGVTVVDPALAAVVTDEREAIAARVRIAEWHDLRAKVGATRSNADGRRLIKVLDDLKEIPHPPGVSEETWRRLQADIRLLERTRLAARGAPAPSR